MSTSSPTTTAEELIAESITINDANGHDITATNIDEDSTGGIATQHDHDVLSGRGIGIQTVLEKNRQALREGASATVTAKSNNNNNINNNKNHDPTPPQPMTPQSQQQQHHPPSSTTTPQDVTTIDDDDNRENHDATTTTTTTTMIDTSDSNKITQVKADNNNNDNDNNEKENDLYSTLPSGNNGMSSLSSKTSLHPPSNPPLHPVIYDPDGKVTAATAASAIERSNLLINNNSNNSDEDGVVIVPPPTKKKAATTAEALIDENSGGGIDMGLLARTINRMLDGNNTKKTDYSTTGIITKKEEEPTVKLVASAKADARNNRDQPAPSDGVDGQKTTGEGNEESGVASGKASKKDDGSNDDAAAEAWIARAVLKVQWTDQEDSIVIDAVTNSSEQPFRLWHDLAQRLPGRVGPQIMVRWRNQLNPNINHLPFSREDDLLLWEGHKKLGNRWVEISEKCFNSTRSERHIQNRWNSVSFKKFISTKDSLIETHGDVDDSDDDESIKVDGGTSKRVYRRGKCTVGDCDNNVVQGGLCVAHGAKCKQCNHPGCIKPSRKAGLCSAHGPAGKRCDFEDCGKAARQGGRCDRHFTTEVADLLTAAREEKKRKRAEEMSKQKVLQEEKKRKKAKEISKQKALQEEKKRKRAEEMSKQKVLQEEKKRKRAEEMSKQKALQEEKKRKRAEEMSERKEGEKQKDGITPTSTYLFDHQKPTKTPTTEVLHDVEYNKRFVRPYICGGFVYSPSKGVSTDNLVVALIKEIMLLLDQKLLTKNDVTALFHKRTIQDGAYIQLNLKGGGADKILHNFKNIAPIICFLIKKWKNNPDTSKGDKMLIYPPGASTDTHIDEEKTHRINLHFGEEKTLMLVKDKQLSTIYDELICKPNCEYQIYGGNGNMFCNSTICFHKGMIKEKSAGFTIVTNPQSNEIALERPAFLSDVFLELNSLVKDLKCSSQSVEHYSHLLKEKFSTYREKL